MSAPTPPPQRPIHLWRTVLSCAAVLLAFVALDFWLSYGRQAGWERNTVRNALARIEGQPTAKVAIFGSSTSKDWLPSEKLADWLGVEAQDVLDAHINGCHQDCTWAELRAFLRLGRRFEATFIGTNLFQLCEFEHTKRILQQSMMTPAADLPALLWSYRHAQRPLRSTGRLLGIGLSGSYGDSTMIRRRLTMTLNRIWRPVEEPTLPPAAWATKRPLPSTSAPPLSCAYGPDDIALKRAYSEGILDMLSQMSTHVFLLLLPDRTLSLDEPEHQRRWAEHRALHEALAAARPQVHLIDLVSDGPAAPALYRDGFHLNERGIAQQQALFEARLRVLLPTLGWPEGGSP